MPKGSSSCLTAILLTVMNNKPIPIFRPMSVFKKFIVPSLIVLLTSASAFPQAEMSLEQCIQLALDRNIGIKRQGLQVDLAKNNLQTSRATRLPNLEGFYAHNLSSGKTVNYENYTYINTRYQDGNVGVQGSLPIFSGFSNWFQVKSDRYLFQSEADKQSELKKSITIQVTTAFLQILYAEEMLGVAESKLESTTE